MAKVTRCGCEAAKAYCTHHSKIKMRVMVKDEYKSTYQNMTFYSFFKEENKPPLTIITKMLKRLESNFKNAYNVILFYDNQNRENPPIHIHK